MRKRTFIIIAGLLSVLILGEAAFLLAGGNEAPQMGVATFEDARAYWRSQIVSVGPDASYALFKDEYEGGDFGLAHSYAHIFGELLYETQGLKGFASCDSAFAFGCYHSFFGTALDDLGLSAIKDLDEACIERYGLRGTGCQHGIGHGVMAYLGEEKLDDALDVCATLAWQEPIGGCTSGVFMEYNFHTMDDPSGITTRKMDERPHFPCDSVPQKFRQACYFEQPAWWALAGGRTDHMRAARLCAEVTDKLPREACFRGLGNSIAPHTRYDIDASRAMCDGIESRDDRRLCREGASWSFFAEPAMRDFAPKLCEDLPSEDANHCIKGSQII